MSIHPGLSLLLYALSSGYNILMLLLSFLKPCNRSTLFLTLVFFGCSGGGLAAYSDTRSAYSDNGDQFPKKKVVVLGTGWAGTSFVKSMKNSSYDIHVVSPRNYFAFTPLLPSVTCGTVEARSIVEPIRNISRKVYTKHHF